MRAVAIVLVFLCANLVHLGPATATGCVSSAQANDCVGDAIEWFGKTESFSNAGATMEPGEPALCEGSAVTSSVWFFVEVVEPGSSDQLGIELSVDWWATLGIYRKDADGALQLVSCSTSWYDEGLHPPTTFAPCTPGAVYWIQVGGMGSGQQGSFTLSEYSSFWRDECWFKPTLPTEPRLSTPTPGNRKVSLSWVEPWWDGGRSVTLSHYNVYRGASCDGPFQLVGSPTSRGFTDTGLEIGTTYCYEVTAVNPVGEGPSQAGRTATTWPLPRPPTGLAVAPAGDGELRLTWQSSPDYDGPARMEEQRVYRAESADGPFVHVGTAGASEVQWRDTGLGRGVTMYYRVSAVSEVGEGPPGGVAAGTTWRQPGPPSDVKVRHVVTTARVVEFEVTWSPPADPAPFSHYRVYRATSPDGPAELVGEVENTRTRFVDPWRTPLVPYYYEVRSSNPAGESDPSARTCFAFPAATVPVRCR